MQKLELEPVVIRPYVPPAEAAAMWLQPRAINDYGDAEPFPCHVQRYENGKPVDRWSNDPAMYPKSGHGVSWRVEPSRIGEELPLPVEPRPVDGDPVYDEGKPPLFFVGEDPGMEDLLGFVPPDPPQHTKGRVVRSRKLPGFVWDEDWNEKRAFDASPDTEYSRQLVFAKDREGRWFCGDRDRPSGSPQYKDYPAHDGLPWMTDRPADWLKRMFKRERVAWSVFVARRGFKERWRSYYARVKVRADTLSVNPADHASQKEHAVGWPRQSSRSCKNYRLLISSRCRPEDYASHEPTNKHLGDIPQEAVSGLAVVKRFPGAENGLNVGAWEIMPWGVEMEIATERQLCEHIDHFPPEFTWIYEEKNFKRRWRATLAYEEVESAVFRQDYLATEDSTDKLLLRVAVDAIRSGVTIKEVARIVGKSESTIKGWISARKEAMSLGKLVKAYMNLPNLNQMLEMLERGFSHRRIARELCVDRSTIDNWVSGLGELLLEIEQEEATHENRC